MKKLFELGFVVATPSILAMGFDPTPFINRHQSGDYGNICAEDKEQNDFGVAKGERIMSVYKVGEQDVWIITERDRSVTTVLLPEDY